MSNTKHTEGPWEFRHSEKNRQFVVVGTKLGGKYKIARCPYVVEGFDREETEANAKLIAAAPELLENLTRLLDRINENDLWNMFPSACERSEAAIKKATE